MRTERTNYKFSLKTRKHYYNYYFNYKTLEQEDNVLILVELILVDLNEEENILNPTITKRIEIFDRNETDLVKFAKFFLFSVDLLNKYKVIYLLLFKTPCTKKQLWDDLVYKLKFKHLHPDLNYDFPNPYENSDKLIF